MKEKGVNSMSHAPGTMLYWEMFEMLLTLPEDKMKTMLATIYHFARGEAVEEPEDPMLLAVWKLTSQRIAEDRDRYEKRCMKNKRSAYRRYFQNDYAPAHGLDPMDEEEFQKYVELQTAIADSVLQSQVTATTTATAAPAPAVTPASTAAAAKKKEKKKAALSFSPPSAAQVEAYCRERKLNQVNPRLFVDFYDSIGWQVGNHPMLDWKAAARSWNERGEKHGKTELSTAGWSELAGHL